MGPHGPQFFFRLLAPVLLSAFGSGCFFGFGPGSFFCLGLRIYFRPDVFSASRYLSKGGSAPPRAPNLLGSRWVPWHPVGPPGETGGVPRDLGGLGGPSPPRKKERYLILQPRFQARSKQCGGLYFLLVAPPRRTSPPAGEARVACCIGALRAIAVCVERVLFGGTNLLLVAPPRRTSPPAGEARVACCM